MGNITIKTAVTSAKASMFVIPKNKILEITDVEISDTSGSTNSLTLTDDGTDLDSGTILRPVLYEKSITANESVRITDLKNKKVLLDLRAQSTGDMDVIIQGVLK